jgi:hypothetical protein
MNQELKYNGHWDGQPIFRKRTIQEKLLAIVIDVEKERLLKKELNTNRA